MLVLGRRPGQRLFLTVPPSRSEMEIVVTINEVDNCRGESPVVQVGIDAARSVKILRDDARIAEPKP